ncbi:MAG: diguanylate cyclase [Candidatus Methylumidiphilus sp.]
MKSQSSAGDMQTSARQNPKVLLPGIFGFLLFLSLGSVVEWFLFEYRQERSAEMKATTDRHGENIRARLEGELNAVFYLSNGIANNRAVHRDLSAPDRTRSVFTEIFRHSRHVRSFAIAEGYRIAYVFPPDDVVQPLDSDYENNTAQWPLIQRSVETHAPLLEWMNPPARGLTYLVPIFEDGQFWGLFSTLIDDSSLFSAAGLTQASGEYEYALRVQSDDGAKAGAILGSDALFADPEALISDIAIPGGIWQLAVKSAVEPTPGMVPQLFFALGWLFATLFAVLAMALWTLNRKLADLAFHDRLTGLPSRLIFLDRLKQVIRRTKRSQGSFSILFTNLNEFKSINESHGEKVGDMMLAGIGKRMIGFIRHCDTVTRWGGDEFLILLDECPHDQAKIIADNLRHQIELPMYCGEHKLRIGASIGLATFPDDGQSLTALLKVAGDRMSKDKSSQKIGR